MFLADLTDVYRNTLHLGGVSGRIKPKNGDEAALVAQALGSGAKPILDPFSVSDCPPAQKYAIYQHAFASKIQL